MYLSCDGLSHENESRNQEFIKEFIIFFLISYDVYLSWHNTIFNIIALNNPFRYMYQKLEELLITRKLKTFYELSRIHCKISKLQILYIICLTLVYNILKTYIIYNIVKKNISKYKYHSQKIWEDLIIIIEQSRYIVDL